MTAAVIGFWLLGALGCYLDDQRRPDSRFMLPPRYAVPVFVALYVAALLITS